MICWFSNLQESVVRSLLLYVCYVDRCLSSCSFYLAIALYALHWFPASDYPFGIFKLLTFALSVLLRFPASDYPFGIFKLLNFALSVLLRFTASHYYPFGIFNLFLNNSRLRNNLLIHHGLIMGAPSEGHYRCHQWSRNFQLFWSRGVPPVVSRIRVAWSLVFYLVLCGSVF